MKRLALLLAVVAVVGLMGCGGTRSASTFFSARMSIEVQSTAKDSMLEVSVGVGKEGEVARGIAGAPDVCQAYVRDFPIVISSSWRTLSAEAGLSPFGPLARAVSDSGQVDLRPTLGSSPETKRGRR